MRRGEVWWGGARLQSGSRKRRPFLVVSADIFNANPRYPKVMVVVLTTTPRSTIPDWEVDLPRGSARLAYASIAKCSEVYTIGKDALDELAGMLTADQMKRVDAALATAFNLWAP